MTDISSFDPIDELSSMDESISDFELVEHLEVTSSLRCTPPPSSDIVSESGHSDDSSVGRFSLSLSPSLSPSQSALPSPGIGASEFHFPDPSSICGVSSLSTSQATALPSLPTATQPLPVPETCEPAAPLQSPNSPAWLHRTRDWLQCPPSSFTLDEPYGTIDNRPSHFYEKEDGMIRELHQKSDSLLSSWRTSPQTASWCLLLMAALLIGLHADPLMRIFRPDAPFPAAVQAPTITQFPSQSRFTDLLVIDRRKTDMIVRQASLSVQKTVKSLTKDFLVSHAQQTLAAPCSAPNKLQVLQRHQPFDNMYQQAAKAVRLTSDQLNKAAQQLSTEATEKVEQIRKATSSDVKALGMHDYLGFTLLFQQAAKAARVTSDQINKAGQQFSTEATETVEHIKKATSIDVRALGMDEYLGFTIKTLRDLKHSQPFDDYQQWAHHTVGLVEHHLRQGNDMLLKCWQRVQGARSSQLEERLSISKRLWTQSLEARLSALRSRLQ